MTPNELYARVPEKTDKDLEILTGCYYNHIKEIESLSQYGVKLDPEKNDRIEIKYYKDFDFDGRRFWRLASIWFDDKPIMIIQNAGREGDDSHRRIITDSSGYGEMIGYIAKELIIYELQSNSKAEDGFYDADEDVEGIDDFYGNSLDGYFERSRY
jgi:hypothetical protein